MSETQEQSIPIKPEISPSSVAEAGKPSVDKSLQKPKGIQKKQLAARLMASAVIAANIGLKGDTIARGLGGELVVTPTGVVRELSVQDLEERAESLYQIQIMSPDEFTEVDIGGKKVKTEKWTKEEIADLMRALDKLPPHFYLPGVKDIHVFLPSLSRGSGFGIDPSKDIKQQEKQWEAIQKQIEQQNDEMDIAAIRVVLGKDFKISKKQLDEARRQGDFEKKIEGALPVEFIIPDVIPLNLRSGGKVINAYDAQCYCGTSSANPKVLLRHNYSFSTIVHELTHRVSKPEDYKFASELLEVPESMDFNDFVYNNGVSHSKNFSALKDAGFNAWVENNNYYYGTRNANEYISVASESYIDGKENFLKIYSIFIGEEKANKLYDYMRDNIFRGTEYKDYQIERKP